MKKLFCGLALLAMCFCALAQGPIYSGGFIVKDSKGSTISGDDGAFNLMGNVNIQNTLTLPQLAGGQILWCLANNKVVGPVSIGSGISFDTGTGTLSANLPQVGSGAAVTQFGVQRFLAIETDATGGGAAVGIGASAITTAGNSFQNASATHSAYTLLSTVTPNSGVFISPGGAPFSSGGGTLVFHAVIAVTNLTATRTIAGFSSQNASASAIQLGTQDLPGAGTNAVYWRITTNVANFCLVTSDGSASTVGDSQIPINTNTNVFDIVGSTASGQYVGYINGVSVITNTQHLPSAALGLAVAGRCYSGNYGCLFYGLYAYQTWTP